MEAATTSENVGLTGKRVLISGGTTGIGRATAIRLGREGARVLIFGRHQQELEDALRDMPGEVEGLTADQAEAGDIERVFAEVDRRLGGLDILINNAALGAGSVLEDDYAHWEYVVRTNLIGYLACCRYAVDRMEPLGAGHIVNVGSMSAEVREKDSDLYVATKAAIEGFSGSIRKKLHKLGVRLTLIEPGSVGTDMSADETPPEQQQKEIQARRMLKAEDIAEMIHFTLVQPDRTEVVLVQMKPLEQEI